MTDVFSRKKRSHIMSLVKGKGNRATELRLAEIFRQHGVKGWRRHVSLFGKPDFAFPKARVAIFVDGCFWHGCPIHGSLPNDNRDFWIRKLEKNRVRDQAVRRALKASGWRTLRVWQHELKDPGRVVRRVNRAMSVIPRE